eukprot:1185958-Prorocentrum_minimum.AAC.6
MILRHRPRRAASRPAAGISQPRHESAPPPPSRMPLPVALRQTPGPGDRTRARAPEGTPRRA